jgi:hypothetical protein
VGVLCGIFNGAAAIGGPPAILLYLPPQRAPAAGGTGDRGAAEEHGGRMRVKF